jgi:hypothetical protein
MSLVTCSLVPWSPDLHIVRHVEVCVAVARISLQNTGREAIVNTFQGSIEHLEMCHFSCPKFGMIRSKYVTLKVLTVK